jgi:myo-inositol-1(or 4)-monophosphatase
MNPDIQKMIAAARAGGAVLKNYFGQSLETIEKSMASDFRTKADLESEEAVLGMLIADFPDYNIYSEEMGRVDKHSDYTFVVDPLDGTNNFSLGIPNFSVSVGLMKGEELVAGVIYAPMIDQVFSAVKGQGAFQDGIRLHVSRESTMQRSTLSNCCSYSTPPPQATQRVKELYERGAKRVTNNWSPAFDFCLLANGRLEGMIVRDIELYDFAAGKLIALEAGATCTDFQGQPEPTDKNIRFVMSNGTAIHNILLEIAQNYVD